MVEYSGTDIESEITVSSSCCSRSMTPGVFRIQNRILDQSILALDILSDENLRARCIARGIAASDQLRQRLGRELLSAQLLPLLIRPLHQSREQINPLTFLAGFQPLVDSGNGNASEILDRLDSVAKERIGQVHGVRFELRHASQRGADLSSAIQHLNGRCIGDGRRGRLAHLGPVPALSEHAKRRAEGQIADDVEGEVVEPAQAVQPRVSRGRRSQAVPLPHELDKIGVDVLFKVGDVLGREGVRDGLPLARVLGAVPRVEETAANGDKGIVVLAMRVSPRDSSTD